MVKRSLRKTRYIIYRQTIVRPQDHFWTFLGAFTGIGLTGLLHGQYFGKQDAIFLIGSFGATAVLLYGATNSPLAQPRNLLLGHFISAVIGVTIRFAFSDWMWLAAASAVSLSIVAMQILKALHPPGGATALIAVIGSERIHDLGYWYVLFPVMSGVLLLFLVALIVNNIPSNRNYPYRK